MFENRLNVYLSIKGKFWKSTSQTLCVLSLNAQNNVIFYETLWAFCLTFLCKKQHLKFKTQGIETAVCPFHDPIPIIHSGKQLKIHSSTVGPFSKLSDSSRAGVLDGLCCQVTDGCARDVVANTA